MIRLINTAAPLFFVLICVASKSDAATHIPYEILLLDTDGVSTVTFDSGVQERLTPLPEDFEFRRRLVASPDDSIFVLGGEKIIEVEGGISLGMDVARLDPVTNQWDFTEIRGSLSVVWDLDAATNGQLFVSDEFGVYEVDLQEKRISGDLVDFQDLIRESPQPVEIDSLRNLISSTFSRDIDESTVLFRQPPDADMSERIDIGKVQLNDYVLESDSSAIGVSIDGDKLYRVNLDANTSELIFEQELLKGVRLQLDPDGRAVVLAGLPRDRKLMRIDFDAGTTEILALNDSSSDLDIRIIPEPSTSLLLLLGVVGTLNDFFYGTFPYHLLISV